MKSALKSARSPFPAESIERILSRYYQQLVEWSLVLARGDRAAAEESVQDLCLHLTVAQPDLSEVHSLDNYLFMCLRNMYVSNLARISRERLRIIQVEDYDVVGMVSANGGLETVDVQNELLRICDYVMARKYISKSASHFILHFFLGYRRGDVALLARLPIAAIYNKLKEVRGELREYLTAGEKIRLVRRGAAPERKLLRTAIASDLFLKELRSTILNADTVGCIAEATLVESYRQSNASPVGLQELAHLAGCERCLKILERILQLDNHDGPLDGIDTSSMPKREERKSFEATMRMVRRRREQIMERRPGLLAIAVDGNVVAFHAVESAHNSLSSRVDAVVTVRFIEVFNEFGDRLAHIPLETETKSVPSKRLSQQVSLSDDRSLHLNVSFDGLGIHAEVDYIDPALAPTRKAEEQPHEHKASVSFWECWVWLPQFRLIPWGVAAFASVLLAAAVGIASYRYQHPGWQEVLSRAQATNQVPSPDETLHQVLRIEEESTRDGKGSLFGSVDVWRSNKQVVRHLYDGEQKLLATSMSAEEGTNSVFLEKDALAAQHDRELVEGGVWQSDVSIAAFAARPGKAGGVSRNANGFEVTQYEDGKNGVLSRTLVLDRDYQVQGERVRYQAGKGVLEVRLVQTLLRRVPNRDVPAGTFSQPHESIIPGGHSERNLPIEPSGITTEKAVTANLEVAVLYKLFQQNADTGQPIEVTPAARGRVRISGTLADAQLLKMIRERVAALPGASQVDFNIYSTTEAASAVHRGKMSRQELVASNKDAPATALVRNTLLARGLQGAALQNAEKEFADSMLLHAQTALQHAYALDRLGTILQLSGKPSLELDARSKWTEMVEGHSAIALTELKALRVQLDSIALDVAPTPPVDQHAITDAAAFARTTSELRRRAQSINEQVVELFTSSTANLAAGQVRESIANLQSSLPITEAGRMRSFANHLAKRNVSAQDEVGEIRPH